MQAKTALFRVRTGPPESTGVSTVLMISDALVFDVELTAQDGARAVVATVTLQDILDRAVQLLITLMGDQEGQVLLEMGQSLDIWCDGLVVATITPMLRNEGG